MLIFDGHLDLAWNALQWNRDLTKPVGQIREGPQVTVQVVEGYPAPARMDATVSLPEMRIGRVGLCFATLLARSTGRPVAHLDWPSPEQACAIALGQLGYYRALENRGHLKVITDLKGLDRQADQWEAWMEGRPSILPLAEAIEATASSPADLTDIQILERKIEECLRKEYATRQMHETREGPADPPRIGVIISMEGADPILTPEHLESWHSSGLRVIGLSHFGPGRYAGGTGGDDGLTPLARPLLDGMRRLRMILDVTHLSDRAFHEAMRIWDGPVLASHNNCRALVPGRRQFSDQQLKEVIEREGVIGAVLDAWMLKPDWVRGSTTNEGVTLETVANHIDHVCQLAGDAKHAAIGSDLDGGFGREQSPSDLDSIADLKKLAPILANRGYKYDDIKGIMHGNWLALLRRARVAST